MLFFVQNIYTENNNNNYFQKELNLNQNVVISIELYLETGSVPNVYRYSLMQLTSQ